MIVLLQIINRPTADKKQSDYGSEIVFQNIRRGIIVNVKENTYSISGLVLQPIRRNSAADS
jgi:hypothetical protein